MVKLFQIPKKKFLFASLVVSILVLSGLLFHRAIDQIANTQSAADKLMTSEKLILEGIAHPADGGSIIFVFKSGMLTKFALLASHQDVSLGVQAGFQQFFISSNMGFETKVEIELNSAFDMKLRQLIKTAQINSENNNPQFDGVQIEPPKKKHLKWLKLRIDNRKTQWEHI